MKLTIEFEREDDTRWMAEVVEFPGVMAYGSNRAGASTRVRALALHCLADMVAHAELDLPTSQREALDNPADALADLLWFPTGGGRPRPTWASTPSRRRCAGSDGWWRARPWRC